MPFTVNVLKQLHTLLFRYMPGPGGEWKGAPNDIIEKHPDGTVRIRFKPTLPHLVEPQIQALCENYAAAVDAQREALVLVPLAVLDFLCIHPFRDGNGRIARLITLMLLYRFDYQVGRYISLERVIEQSKQTYYETLEASSQGWHEGRHDAMPWLNYFWGVMQRAYSEFRERVTETQPAGRGSKTEQITPPGAAADEALQPDRDTATDTRRQPGHGPARATADERTRPRGSAGQGAQRHLAAAQGEIDTRIGGRRHG